MKNQDLSTSKFAVLLSPHMTLKNLELALVYMTLYGRLVEPLEVGKISNNKIIHSFIEKFRWDLSYVGLFIPLP
jgi:hypothetical protein